MSLAAPKASSFMPISLRLLERLQWLQVQSMLRVDLWKRHQHFPIQDHHRCGELEHRCLEFKAIQQSRPHAQCALLTVARHPALWASASGCMAMHQNHRGALRVRLGWRKQKMKWVAKMNAQMASRKTCQSSHGTRDGGIRTTQSNLQQIMQAGHCNRRRRHRRPRHRHQSKKQKRRSAERGEKTRVRARVRVRETKRLGKERRKARKKARNSLRHARLLGVMPLYLIWLSCDDFFMSCYGRRVLSVFSLFFIASLRQVVAKIVL